MSSISDKLSRRRSHASCKIMTHSLHQSRSRSLTTYSQQLNVSGFPLDAGEADAGSLLSTYGTIVKIQKNPQNPNSNQETSSFSVTFSTSTEAKMAFDSIPTLKVGENNLQATFVIPIEREERASMSIFIRRIPKTVNLDQIKKLFGRFGEIDNVEQYPASDPLQRFWRCSITYASFDAASAAIAEMDGFVISDNKPLIVRFKQDSPEQDSHMLLRRHSRSTISQTDLFNKPPTLPSGPQSPLALKRRVAETPF